MTLDNTMNFIKLSIGFIVIILLLQLIGGGDLSANFLMLVVLSMVVLNSDKVVSFLKNYF